MIIQLELLQNSPHCRERHSKSLRYVYLTVDDSAEVIERAVSQVDYLSSIIEAWYPPDSFLDLERCRLGLTFRHRLADEVLAIQEHLVRQHTSLPKVFAYQVLILVLARHS